MAHVSRKLSNALEGALAGGGDPATSPLYIFGPFLKLIVVAGVAQVTFGASVWLVVLTIATVSAMYRLVMSWVTDGSGGSGLSEEEFGSWAVRVNAGITFIEYTLTFLVSMAALVTFLADRLPVLNESFAGFQYRTYVAIGLSFLTGWLVNRGPKAATYAFGPATAGVLLLLWLMVGATLLRFGLQLPTINLAAFTGPYIGFTFGGFARILAVMTGIEVFANLVAAYDGTSSERSRKAFGSLLIIMGTTSITMVIVGPAIHQLADPTNEHVSVFTQTMDLLLPAPLPLIGTFIGVAVLLSASAASAQGLQNLFVGLKYRHYVPEQMGRRNRFDVAPYPVWLQVGIVAVCFLAFGTSEETYLAIYAAGVFILLSMTGWAAAKRLLREIRERFSTTKTLLLTGTVIAALLTSGATIVIFEERFVEGAWTYFLFIPILYVAFGYFRRQLGEPTAIEDRLGALLAHSSVLEPPEIGRWQENKPSLRHILVPLDGSALSEQALPIARALARVFASPLSLFTVDHDKPQDYLEHVSSKLADDPYDVRSLSDSGPVADSIRAAADQHEADLVVMSTSGHSGVKRLLLGSVASQVVQRATKPVLLVRAQSNLPPGAFQKILVTLDGSEFAERVLPYAREVATCFSSEVLFLTVPQSAQAEGLGLKMRQYLEGVAETFARKGLSTRVIITGEEPVGTIVQVGRSEQVDLIMMASHGRGGLKRILMGSVADAVMRQAGCPVFVTPVQESREPVAGAQTQ